MSILLHKSTFYTCFNFIPNSSYILLFFILKVLVIKGRWLNQWLNCFSETAETHSGSLKQNLVLVSWWLSTYWVCGTLSLCGKTGITNGQDMQTAVKVPMFFWRCGTLCILFSFKEKLKHFPFPAVIFHHFNARITLGCIVPIMHKYNVKC